MGLNAQLQLKQTLAIIWFPPFARCCDCYTSGFPTGNEPVSGTEPAHTSPFTSAPLAPFYLPSHLQV